MTQPRLIIPFRELDLGNLAEVGGKNASLGELLRGLHSAGVRVPDGFAITAAAFRSHLAQDGSAGRKVGLCGQAPSDHPEFAEFLADIGLDSLSVTADALPAVIRKLGMATIGPSTEL